MLNISMFLCRVKIAEWLRAKIKMIGRAGELKYVAIGERKEFASHWFHHCRTANNTNHCDTFRFDSQPIATCVYQYQCSGALIHSFVLSMRAVHIPAQSNATFHHQTCPMKLGETREEYQPA
jgi:hypothetical protein